MDATRRSFLAAAGTTGAYNLAQAQDHGQPHDHSHGHSHQAVPSDLTLRVKALESLLVEKGLVDRAALDALVDTYEHKVGPRNGARVVARAWADPAYKQRLLTDSTAAIAELGYGGQQGEYMVVVGGLTVPLHNAWADAAIAYQKEHYPKMKLAADRFGTGESLDETKRVTQDTILAHPNLKGALVFGSSGVVGAAQAVKDGVRRTRSP